MGSGSIPLQLAAAGAGAIDRDYLLHDYESVIAGSGVVQSVHVQADVDEQWALQETNWLLSMGRRRGAGYSCRRLGASRA